MVSSHLDTEIWKMWLLYCIKFSMDLRVKWKYATDKFSENGKREITFDKNIF